MRKALSSFFDTLEVLGSDMFSHTHALGFPKSNFLNRHPSESLNNPLLITRFSDGQTGGRKAETE